MVDHGMFALDLEDGVTHDAGFAMHEESEEELEVCGGRDWLGGGRVGTTRPTRCMTLQCLRSSPLPSPVVSMFNVDIPYPSITH